MDVWERKAAVAVNAARSLVVGEQQRLKREVRESAGRGDRNGELEAILDLLEEVKAHIDPHRVVEWEFQTPLPF